MIYRAKGLVRRFDGGETLEFPDFEIAAGARFGLVGGNGSGKTTLAELLVGLAKPAVGTLEFVGEPLVVPVPTPLRRRIAYVAQQPFPLPGTVEANVALAVPPETARSERRAEARRWLERLGIAEFGGKQERALSVGQLRRVAVARAFARGSDVLILDEPFAFGDEHYRAVLAEMLEEHHSHGGTTIVTSPQPSELDGWATDRLRLG